MEKKGEVKFLSPDGLAKNPAFSQVAVISGPHKTIYVGGQNATDRNGNIIGKGDIAKQSQQILHNLEEALRAAGAGFEHVVKWNIYFLKGVSPQDGLKEFQPALSKLKSPPLVTGVFVEALARPDFLMEIEVTAVLPE